MKRGVLIEGILRSVSGRYEA